MAKRVKNTDSETHAWVGQEIEPDAYYDIETIELFKWQNDSDVLTDIGSGILVMNNGDDDIIDVADAINFLKDVDTTPRDSDGVPLARQRAFANDDGFRFRGKGISGTATKNTTTNLDYKITETRSINGVKLICKNHVFGDTVKFQIVDVDNVLGYGAGLVLDEFGTDWNLEEDRQGQGQEILPYRANVNAGFWIRIVYISVGIINDVSLRVNLYLHKKT